MESMQKLFFASALGLACALPLAPAQAGGTHPGFHARMLLKYSSGWRLYHAGCLTWNDQQHAWYSHCGLPQNAPLYPPPSSPRTDRAASPRGSGPGAPAQRARACGNALASAGQNHSAASRTNWISTNGMTPT